jgi:hypothetical protein
MISESVDSVHWWLTLQSNVKERNCSRNPQRQEGKLQFFNVDFKIDFHLLTVNISSSC